MTPSMSIASTALKYVSGAFASVSYETAAGALAMVTSQ